MKLKIKGKQGDITDILSFVIVTFILIVGFFIIAYIIPFISTGLTVGGLNNSAEGTNAINLLNDYGVNGIQKGVYFLFIGLCISLLISSFFTNEHPIWLFLYIMLLIVTVITAGYLAYSYDLIISSTNFNGFTQPYMTTIMQNIIPVTIIVAGLSFIIIFAKYQSGGNRF